MNVRKLVFIIVLIFTIPHFVGCQLFVGQNLSDSSLSEDLYDELVRYTIFNYEWLDEENIIVCGFIKDARLSYKQMQTDYKRIGQYLQEYHDNVQRIDNTYRKIRDPLYLILLIW